jgi:K+-transporting ATPase ATPase C chain
MKQILPAIKIFLFMTVLTGLLYPLLVTGIGKVLFPRLASGMMIERGGHIIGARMISQKFVSTKYFWGRPSAVDFNPLSSGGSNLGPTSEALKKAVQERIEIVRKAHDLSNNAVVPQDLIFASASGLDSDISPEAAFFQLSRVAKARGMSEDQVGKLRELVERHVENPDLGFIGEPRVNVLELNLAMDEANGIR